MSTLPPLLETYEEARLLLEAKGWGIAKAAEHLSELPGMARFHISHNKLSTKTKPGAHNAIEPEVAAAVEGLETRRGYERQTEIVTTGLLARHGTRPAVQEPPSVSQRVVRVLREFALRFRHASWKPIAITAASGALVGCLVLLVAGAARPGPLMVIVSRPSADHSPAWVGFDPKSLLDVPAKWGEKPLDQPIPTFTLPGQKVAPCDAGLSEEVINGNCWMRSATVKPPCGRLFRQGDACYRPIAAEPKKPAP
jgi:hypothetical protein